MRKRLFLAGMVLAALGTSLQAQDLQPVKAVPYEWSSVPIVGGGFVDGIVIHPTAPGVRYCRTDMGGAYRWDALAERWIPLMDWITLADSNLQGVESIAIDPQNPNNVYIACGTYTTGSNGAVLCSSDGGRSFTRVDVPFTFGGNEDGRGNGERMMVDPQNGNIIYLGTRQHGLWRSTDKGQSWARVTSFPDVTEKLVQPADRRMRITRGSGIICVVFGNNGEGDARGTRDIYVAVSLKDRENLFVSRDFGESWQPVEGQPTKYRPTHMVLAADGQLLLSYADAPGPSQMSDGALWKYDTRKNVWKDISPVKYKDEKAGFGYAAVSVDVNNPSHIIVSTHSLGGKRGYESDEMFRSTDGGKRWKPIFKTGYEYDVAKAPYVKKAPLHWMFDIEIDSQNPEHALFTTGFGGWETFNLSAVERGEKVVWSIMSTGIEETVPLEFYAPTEGARLISGVGDYGGFTHFKEDLNRPVPRGSHSDPEFANTNGIAGAWLKQNVVVRVGVPFHRPEALSLSYSEDGGITWVMTPSVPVEGARNGHIAVAADASSWIWTPDRADAYITRDKGATWQLCEGLPKNTRVIADKVNPKRFYAVDAVAEIVYSSEDGGHTFRADSLQLTVKPMRMRSSAPAARNNRGDNRGGQDRIYSTPGFEKDLWIAAYDGLYHSTAMDGYDFRVLNQVRTIYAFGFGKEKPGNDYPCLYLIGVVNGQYGFFRSDDAGTSWVRINDDAHQYGLVLHIIGDMQEYGRVYIGTHGRGIITGTPK